MRTTGFKRRIFFSNTLNSASTLILISNLNWRRQTLITKYTHVNRSTLQWFFTKIYKSSTLRIFKQIALNFWYIFWISCTRSLKTYMFQTKMQKEQTPKMDNGMKLVKKIRKSLLEIKTFLTRSKKVLSEIFSEEL